MVKLTGFFVQEEFVYQLLLLGYNFAISDCYDSVHEVSGLCRLGSAMVFEQTVSGRSSEGIWVVDSKSSWGGSDIRYPVLFWFMKNRDAEKLNVRFVTLI